MNHPHRGTIFLLSTDLSLQPLQIIQLYGFRFNIELGFHQALRVLGAYAYHFWMSGMKPIHRGQGDQYLHRATARYRAAVCRKLDAFHPAAANCAAPQAYLLALWPWAGAAGGAGG